MGILELHVNDDKAAIKGFLLENPTTIPTISFFDKFFCGFTYSPFSRR